MRFIFHFFLVTSLYAEQVVIGETLGRLGNCLFEVATASAIAWDNGAQAYFPYLPDDYHRTFFYRFPKIPPNVVIDHRWGGPPYGYKEVEYRPNMVVCGYLQNEKYFAHHREKLLALFAPKPKIFNYIRKKYRTILNHPCSVGVHVRHYRAEGVPTESFFQYGRQYYEKAMSLFPYNAQFFVFSDDIAFAKEMLPTNGKRVIFIIGENVYTDFHLLSNCKHQIISNSSFSWWAAWLNQNPDKKVVRPLKWVGGYPDIGGPDDWIRVDAKPI
ncbi:MAG: alpha-1,2-fucosyltransferase [Simkaniaceae bacterium]|nr:alpha-1,2-fucosyltransferase [Simkaniaceae bacterium]